MCQSSARILFSISNNEKICRESQRVVSRIRHKFANLGGRALFAVKYHTSPVVPKIVPLDPAFLFVFHIDDSFFPSYANTPLSA
jgi:hypothetical protein